MPKKLQEAFASNQEIAKWPKELKQWRRKPKKNVKKSTNWNQLLNWCEWLPLLLHLCFKEEKWK